MATSFTSGEAVMLSVAAPAQRPPEPIMPILIVPSPAAWTLRSRARFPALLPRPWRQSLSESGDVTWCAECVAGLAWTCWSPLCLGGWDGTMREWHNDRWIEGSV